MAKYKIKVTKTPGIGCLFGGIAVVIIGGIFWNMAANGPGWNELFGIIAVVLLFTGLGLIQDWFDDR